jgi:hypothetical protein
MEAGDRIARLDPNLRAEVLRDRTAAIKAEAFPSLGPLHEAIVKRAAAAKAAESTGPRRLSAARRFSR